MSQSNLTIATLVGSRICHDLISPVGAINNGIELIAMGGPIDTPELRLIADSVHNASARIRFYRIAFGAASGEQMLGAPEISSIAREAYGFGRHNIDWRANGTMSRQEVQAVYLALLCIETALPHGGTIAVTHREPTFRIIGSGPRLASDPALWGPLQDNEVSATVGPAHVQFALLVPAVNRLGRRIRVAQSEHGMEIAF